jgi:DNA-binding transcriptional ArsR family regulator
MSNHNSTRACWDPSSLRIARGDVSPQGAIARKGRRASSVRGKFIAGPVDIVWLSEARKLGGAALWVGLCLWFLRGLKRADSFIVSNLTIREWDVLPDAKTRALRKLEKAGLLTVERRGKRSPRVTLVVQHSNTDRADTWKETYGVIRPD